MKHLLLILFGSVLLACNVSDKKAMPQPTEQQELLAQKAMEDSASFTTLEWLDPVKKDLGKIKKGQVLELTWRFKNTGDKPLFIQNIQPACGCTIAEEPKEPIAPGAEGLIKAQFDSNGAHGHVSKDINVTANNKNRNNNYTNLLTFTAEVEE